MHIKATAHEAHAILGAMLRIAETTGANCVAEADRASLVAAHHYLLPHCGREGPPRTASGG